MILLAMFSTLSLPPTRQGGFGATQVPCSVLFKEMNVLVELNHPGATLR